MAKQINVGVGGVVKTVKKVPFSIGGIVKQAKKGVCGVGGVVKEFFTGLITFTKNLGYYTVHDTYVYLYGSSDDASEYYIYGDVANKSYSIKVSVDTDSGLDLYYIYNSGNTGWLNYCSNGATKTMTGTFPSNATGIMIQCNSYQRLYTLVIDGHDYRTSIFT